MSTMDDMPVLRAEDDGFLLQLRNRVLTRHLNTLDLEKCSTIDECVSKLLADSEASVDRGGSLPLYVPWRSDNGLIEGYTAVPVWAGEHVGILSRSGRFAGVLRTVCETYTDDVLIDKHCELSDAKTVKAYLKDKSAVLLPEEYEKTVSGEVAVVLHEYAKKHVLIPCAYEMDEGSFLYLREKITRIREKQLK